MTAFYYSGEGLIPGAARRIAPASGLAGSSDRFGGAMNPRFRLPKFGPIGASTWPWPPSARLATSRPEARLRLARWRTRRFDRRVEQSLVRDRPAAALFFSDVGSEFALPACRRLGIASVLSMVHGDVREERRVMEVEAETAPDFFPIYLGSGEVDRAEMDWLHHRRLRDIELADRILVPSEHIAGELVRHGTSRDRIAVVPYAADTRRFVPAPGKTHGAACTFLFAGGITQAQGDQIPAGSLADRFGGLVGVCNCSAHCRPTRARCGRILTRLSGWAGSRTPRFPPGWRRPTCSFFPRSLRGRPL